MLRASLIAVAPCCSRQFDARLRPNAVMGVRTPRTLRDPKLWAQTNRLFGALFVLAGLATIAAAIVALRFALAVAVVGLLCACAITAVYLAWRGSSGKRTAVVLALTLQVAVASTRSRAEMDLQATKKDAERLLEANPKATFLLLPKANHVMKRAESMEVEQQKPLYSDATLPIVDELVPAIVKWFRRL
jgi:hypothetical protein